MDDNNLKLNKISTMNILHEQQENNLNLLNNDSIDKTENININKNMTNMQNLYHIVNEKGISIFLHILIMAIFEIYFYFNYAAKLEKKLLMDKIKSYFDELNVYYEQRSDKKLNEIISYFFNNMYNNDVNSYLEDQYEQAKHEQKILLNNLLLFCLKILISISCILSFFVICGFFHKQSVKWRWIIIENFFMFCLLGLLEYIFFTRVILNYTPFTDAEIKYKIYTELVNILNGTYT
jgi:hypothetical protein